MAVLQGIGGTANLCHLRVEILEIGGNVLQGSQPVPLLHKPCVLPNLFIERGDIGITRADDLSEPAVADVHKEVQADLQVLMPAAYNRGVCQHSIDRVVSFVNITEKPMKCFEAAFMPPQFLSQGRVCFPASRTECGDQPINWSRQPAQGFDVAGPVLLNIWLFDQEFVVTAVEQQFEVATSQPDTGVKKLPECVRSQVGFQW